MRSNGDRETQIMAVLNRQSSVDGLSALVRAYKPEARSIVLAETAIVLDSSVFLRLGSYDDVIDYLNVAHAAPLVLPGQAVQEFWNNNLNVTDSIATGISKKFDALKSEIEKVDSSFQNFSQRFDALLDEFKTSYGYAYDGGTVRRTHSLFELLQRKAIICYVSREKFASLAIHRKMTKTPPGFRDEGDGDFFVWLDMLCALLLAKDRGFAFTQVVLVTNDKKPDWSREGIAHPILSAELAALLDVSFETWDIKKLAREVAAYSG